MRGILRLGFGCLGVLLIVLAILIALTDVDTHQVVKSPEPTEDVSSTEVAAVFKPTLTKKSTDTPQPTATNRPTPATPTTASEELSATVTARGLNVRSGPGIGYQRVGAVGQGTEVALDGRDKTGNWVHGRVVGEDLEGWFSARYMRIVSDVMTLSMVEPSLTIRPATTALPTAVVEPTKAVSAPAQWQKVARWAGNSIKNTETFHISSHEWRISWSTKPGEHGPVNFQIFVYRSDRGLAGVAANVIGEGSDTSIMRGAGDYYLTINTGQPYEVVVEARPTSSASPRPTSKPADTAIWHEIARWTGNSIKNTETFNVPSSEWRIRWSTGPGQYGALNFQIFIYKADGSLAGVAANVIGEGSDTSFMRGRGSYYLTINTGQPYEVIVEAKY